MNSICTLSALELAERIKQKELTVSDAVRAVCSRIREKESLLHCYITLRSETELLKEAALIQARIDSGELCGPLAGVPIAVKDNICTEGLRTTCASKMLDNFIPPYSAEVITRLKQAGLIILGKTNMDEFSMGSTTETSYYGPARNPVDPGHTPGGSSGGSCAAVASGEAFIALGSDTGGSIRLPASYCGVTGLKPTYGAVSRYGLIAYASSLEQIGPIGKTAADCEALFGIICGKDEKDATSVQKPSAGLCPDIKKLRVGIPDYQNCIPADSVMTAVTSTAERLRELGASVETFKMENTDYAVSAYYLIALAEASSNLARFDGVKYGYRAAKYTDLHDMYKKSRTEGFGSEVKKRILLGTFALSEGYYDDYYMKALKARSKIAGAYKKAFQRYDLLLTPTAPAPAPKLGAFADRALEMYKADCFTIQANLAGLPAISIPAGLSPSGLPVGVQLLADHFREDILLYTSKQLEEPAHVRSNDAL